MRGPQLSLHVVHLFHQGSYVPTLPRPFSHAAATAYVASYNRLGQADGRTAVLATVEADVGNRTEEGTRCEGVA